MIKCIDKERSCEQKECRQWLNYDEDLNCALITVEKHGMLTLREIADRLDISFVRVKQIQDQAVKKLVKTIKNRNIDL
jgi:DNA-directed RNA polymerase sigma subunit (sigma70/sigma32)